MPKEKGYLHGALFPNSENSDFITPSLIFPSGAALFCVWFVIGQVRNSSDKKKVHLPYPVPSPSPHQDSDGTQRAQEFWVWSQICY